MMGSSLLVFSLLFFLLSLRDGAYLPSTLFSTCYTRLSFFPACLPTSMSVAQASTLPYLALSCLDPT